jgi:hypothetical protein
MVSCATAIWIPRRGVTKALLQSVLAESTSDSLEACVFTRRTPAVTLIVAPLDEPDLSAARIAGVDLFRHTASRLSKKLRLRTYVLAASFGSSLAVASFGADGRQRWFAQGSEKLAPSRMRSLGQHLRMQVVTPTFDFDDVSTREVLMTGTSFPYWKMIAEVAPKFRQDVLDIGMKPAFDLGSRDGWREVWSFSTQLAEQDDPSTSAPLDLGLNAGQLESTAQVLRAALGEKFLKRRARTRGRRAARGE